MRLPLIVLLAATLSLGAASRAEAHFTSTSYLIAESTDDTHVTWDVSAADVHWSLGLDRDGNGSITWEEIEARRDDIAALALGNLGVSRGGEACDVRFSDLQLTSHAQEPHLSLGFTAKCAKQGRIELTGTLFFDTNSTQRTLIDVTTRAGQFTSILSPAAPRWVEPAAPSMLATFTTFVGQGLWHVWIGYDHLAFLLLLLLPGVLRATGASWQGASTFRETARDLFRIITAFTLAHSTTLALATTGLVHIPVRPVEVAIAASIVIAGLLNLFPSAARARLALAFGFGLVHGFGFANALAALGAHGARLVPTLVGFNVGVELAQLSLVVLVLPWLFRARNSAFYAWRFMPATSLVAAMAGAAWLVARVNV